MKNKNLYETFYVVKEDNEFIEKIKSNTLGLSFMSDDNFVISYIDNEWEEQFYYIDNYKADIIWYVPLLDLTLYGEHLEGISFIEWNPYNIDIKDNFEFVWNL